MSLLRLHFFRNFRTACYLTAYLLIASVFGLILWVQFFGLPKTWCQRLEMALATRGIHASVEKLRYIPFRGLQLDSLVIFDDSQHQSITAQLQQVVIDLDHLKALRGEWQLNSIELSEAQLLLPTTSPDRPIRISHLNGKWLLSEHNSIEIVNASGEIEGIRVGISAHLDGLLKKTESAKQQPGAHQGKDFLPRALIDELQHWRYTPAAPQLTLKVHADVNDLSSMRLQFQFTCPEMSRDAVTMKHVRLEGQWLHSLISINDIHWRDSSGQIQAVADYDLERNEGRFQIESSLNHSALVAVIPTLHLPTDLQLPQQSTISISGKFLRAKDQPFRFQAQGQLNASKIKWKNTSIQQLKTELSCNGQDVFLRNLHLEHDHGALNGKLLWRDGVIRAHAEGAVPLNLVRDYLSKSSMAAAWNQLDVSGLQSIQTELDGVLTLSEPQSLKQLNLSRISLRHIQGHLEGELHLADRHVQYQLSSDLPASVWQPFFATQPLGRVLANFSERDHAEHAVTIRGTQNLDDIYDWTAQGTASIKNMNYRGVPVNHVSTELDLDHHRLRFLNNRIDFHYSDYELSQRFNGNSHGQVNADEVLYDCETGLLKLSAVKGAIYPAPLIRLFAPSLADRLEVYGFHQAPALVGDGIVDIRHNEKTDLRINIQQPVAMDWRFLGEMLTIEQLTGKIHVTSTQVNLQQLKFNCFSGDFQGDLEVNLSDQNPFVLKLDYQNTKLQDIGETYHFDQHSFGDLDGSLRLLGNASDASSLQGSGTCMMKHGQLFTVPIFGPLSTLLASLFDEQVAGIQSATDAKSDFMIHNGLLTFDDFQTHTSTLKFSGFGQIDLPNMSMDMTMKLNTRGLVGLLTLPLQPLFQGIFQFHGSGALRAPVWEHVMFTNNPAANIEKNVPDAIPKNTEKTSKTP